jgi:hypothetical protein
MMGAKKQKQGEMGGMVDEECLLYPGGAQSAEGGKAASAEPLVDGSHIWSPRNNTVIKSS